MHMHIGSTFSMVDQENNTTESEKRKRKIRKKRCRPTIEEATTHQSLLLGPYLALSSFGLLDWSFLSRKFTQKIE